MAGYSVVKPVFQFSFQNTRYFRRVYNPFATDVDDVGIESLLRS